MRTVQQNIYLEKAYSIFKFEFRIGTEFYLVEWEQLAGIALSKRNDEIARKAAECKHRLIVKKLVSMLGGENWQPINNYQVIVEKYLPTEKRSLKYLHEALAA